jgi:methyl-accepting chemotaxis protein
MLILAFVTPVTIVLIAGTAIFQTNSLKYEYDNLYGFMLIPIMSLDQANLHLEEMKGNLEKLSQECILLVSSSAELFIKLRVCII